MNKVIVFSMVLLLFLLNVKAQNHYVGIKAGYTRSSASIPDGTLQIGSGGASQGTDWFKSVNGFQIGVLANIDIGYDYVHLDLSPQYSKYGFEGNSKMYYRFQDKIKMHLDYVDFDIGLSNLNSVDLAKIIAGFGITPSYLIFSKNINDVNNFDLKIYLIIGYKFSQKFTVYAQVRQGFMKLIPESKIKNFQISLNVNIPVFKL